MKVLLDENLDHRLRTMFPGHAVFTVSFMRWSGLKNGELLTAAEDHGFEVFVTGDQTLHHEQSLMGRRIGLVVLTAVEYRIVVNARERLQEAISSALPGTLQIVDCGRFTR